MQKNFYVTSGRGTIKQPLRRTLVLYNINVLDVGLKIFLIVDLRIYKLITCF